MPLYRSIFKIPIWTNAVRNEYFWEMENSIYEPKFVQLLFDKMSRSYERMNFITSFGFSIRWRKQFLSRFAPSQEKLEVIDILTGMGETWQAVKAKFPNAHLTALDFSEGMLSYAKSKSDKKYKNEVVVLQQDVLDNQLPSDHYDLVTCAFGLKTFNPEQLRCLALETKRILKQGGRCTFIEVSKPPNLLLRMLYGFYLGKVIPVLGRLFLVDPEEYRMLWRYTEQFQNAKMAANIFAEAGLKIEFLTYFYGCATGFYGVK